MSTNRLIRFIKQELFQRRLPHGLISWRYLFSFHDPSIVAHRRLWWSSCPSWPRSVWCVIELWLWLRWIFWHAWLSSYRMTKRYGNEIALYDDISRVHFGWTLLRLALSWSIPPQETVRFQLVLHPNRALQYIYGNETASYHQLRNRSLMRGGSSLKILQDKQLLAEELAQIGIPVVSTVTIVPQGSSCTLASQIGQQEHLFCKTRTGNQGKGAFTVWRAASGLAGRRFNGKELTTNDAVERCWRELLALDDALVQPYLVNHPALHPMSHNGDVITVRYITCLTQHSYDCLNATLEVPAGNHQTTGQTVYAIFPIHPETGSIRRFPEHLLASVTTKELQRKTWLLAPEDNCIPHWTAVKEYSYQSHAVFPDIWAIAWDWVITPDGPVLLEGNSGWGLTTPQLLSGGMLLQRSAKTPAASDSASALHEVAD